MESLSDRDLYGYIFRIIGSGIYAGIGMVLVYIY